MNIHYLIDQEKVVIKNGDQTVDVTDDFLKVMTGFLMDKKWDQLEKEDDRIEIKANNNIYKISIERITSNVNQNEASANYDNWLSLSLDFDNIPSDKMFDKAWLIENLPVVEANNPKLDIAMSIIKKL